MKKKIKEEESIEILKILNLISYIEEYQKNMKSLIKNLD